jgi:hypothetical protein
VRSKQVHAVIVDAGRDPGKPRTGKLWTARVVVDSHLGVFTGYRMLPGSATMGLRTNAARELGYP